jgi:MFS family permease
MKPSLLSRLNTGVPPDLQRNFFFWYMDIAVWGLYTGSTVVFLSVYATRIGASAAQIGWLSAGPAIVTLLLAIPFGLWGRRIPTRRGVWVAAFLARFSILVYALIPFIHSPSLQITAILVATTLIAVPNIMVNLLFGPLFLSSVPADWRATVVGNRNAILAIITFIVTLLSGQLLSRIIAPLAYQIVFFIGFIGAVLTAYFLSRVQVNFPEQAVVSGSPAPKNLLPRLDEAGRRYIGVAGLLFLFNVGGSMFAPLSPVFVINSLHLSDGTIAAASALANMLVFIVSLRLPRSIRRLGNRRSTAAGAALVALQMLILAFTQSSWLYMVSAVVGGVAAGVLGIAQYNYHLENLPLQDRTVWLSWNMLVGNIGALLGSMLGPLLAGWTGIPLAFAILAAFRLGIAAVIWKRG